jgi:hypothetical protein
MLLNNKQIQIIIKLLLVWKGKFLILVDDHPTEVRQQSKLC